MPRIESVSGNGDKTSFRTCCSFNVAELRPSAAYIVELVFGVARLVPQQRLTEIVETHITWNYPTWLNIVFLGLAAVLVWRFLKTGGPAMLRMMNEPPPAEAHQHS